MHTILYSTDMAKTVPFTEARASLSKLVDEVAAKQEQVFITRNGQPSVVLLSIAEYESMVETIEALSDEELMESLKRSDEDVKAGRVYTLDEVMREFGLA
jgi:antitoxin YefM